MISTTVTYDSEHPEYDGLTDEERDTLDVPSFVVCTEDVLGVTVDWQGVIYEPVHLSLDAVDALHDQLGAWLKRAKGEMR